MTATVVLVLLQQGEGEGEMWSQSVRGRDLIFADRVASHSHKRRIRLFASQCTSTRKRAGEDAQSDDTTNTRSGA
jgi:hypothetical protein